MAKLVLEVIPTYTMMRNNCLKEIKNVQRKYIWGELASEKHIHIVRWEEEKKLNKFGGLRLMKLTIMNKACIGNLGWKIKIGCEALW